MKQAASPQASITTYLRECSKSPQPRAQTMIYAPFFLDISMIHALVVGSGDHYTRQVRS